MKKFDEKKKDKNLAEFGVKSVFTFTDIPAELQVIHNEYKLKDKELDLESQRDKANRRERLFKFCATGIFVILLIFLTHLIFFLFILGLSYVGKVEILIEIIKSNLLSSLVSLFGTLFVGTGFGVFIGKQVERRKKEF